MAAQSVEVLRKAVFAVVSMARIEEKGRVALYPNFLKKNILMILKSNKKTRVKGTRAFFDFYSFTSNSGSG